MNVSLSPELRRFVRKQVGAGPHKSDGDVVRAGLHGLIARERVRRRVASGLGPWAPGPAGRGPAGLGAGSDIESLVFTVLLEAAKDMDRDLDLIMAEVKAMTNAKQALRSVLAKVGRDVAANAGQQGGRPRLNLKGGMGSPTAYSSFQMPFPDPQASGGVGYYPTSLVPGNSPITSLGQLQAVQAALQGDLDSMNEMSEMTSLRLQMAMDRRSRVMVALSNVMKKIDETQEAIVQNLK